MDEMQLLKLAIETLERVEQSATITRDQVDRLASIHAQLLLLLKRTDAQSANGRLQQQAALNQILGGQERLLALLGNPEALAGIIPGPTLDAARQIKRKLTIAMTGKDPADRRKRDDTDITLVGFPILSSHGEHWKLRVNKRMAKLLFTILGTIAGWLIRHYTGVPH